MRNAFAKQITQIAQTDEGAAPLSGGLGHRKLDDIQEKCDGTITNCGVAEANMIGMAAGMAMSGLRPVCYTITPFLTYRCMEQIRVDVCYHHVPVVIVGTGAGLSYASLGATHHSCEEMGMLRLLPGLSVIAPADEWEVRAAIKAAIAHPQPVYIRIGKKGEPVVHQAEPQFTIGKAIEMLHGDDICILSAGTVLPEAMSAAKHLAARGVSTRVFSFHTVKPLDEAVLSEVFSKCKVVATLEEHSVLGGLGGAVAEWLADHSPAKARLIRFGTPDEFLHETCEQEHAREKFGMTSTAIADRLQAAVT